MPYQYIYIISIIIYLILAVFTLIISKLIYSFLKKKTKLSSLYCFLLIIIPILTLYFKFKIHIETTIELISVLVMLFIYSLYGLLSGQYSFSEIFILLFIIVVFFLSIVGLFLILKLYDKNYSKEDKFSKFSIIISIISLSLLFIFHYQNLIYIASDYILTHLID